VEISCHNLNFKNFWGGEWLSAWQVDLSSNSVAGSIKVHNHYFEQGNIQFNLAKEVPSTNLGGSLTAKAVVDFIDKTETKVRPNILILMFINICCYSTKKGWMRCTVKCLRSCLRA
jgi:capping protein alpha